MDIEITGGRIFYTFPFEIPILGKFQITETLVVSWLVMLLITGLCIWLTHDLKVEKISRRQAVANFWWRQQISSSSEIWVRNSAI